MILQAVKTAYSDIERRFVAKVQRAGRLHPHPLPDAAAWSTPGVCLYEFVRDKWTFHGKGVFLERRYFLDDASCVGPAGGGAEAAHAGIVGPHAGLGAVPAEFAGGTAAGDAVSDGVPAAAPAASFDTGSYNGDAHEHLPVLSGMAAPSQPLLVAPGLSAAGSTTRASAATSVSAADTVPATAPSSSADAAGLSGHAAAGSIPLGLPQLHSDPQPVAIAMLTSVGSSNFGERSEHRDLELQMDLVTSNPACVRRLQLERDALFAADMATRQALVRTLHESYPRDAAVLEILSGGGDGSGGEDAPGAGGNAPGSDGPPDGHQAHVSATTPELWQHGKRKIPLYMLPVTMLAKSLKGYM